MGAPISTPLPSLTDDPTTVSAYEGDGMDDVQALLAANTTMSMTQPDPHTIDLAGSTPVGSDFQIAIAAHDGQSGDPTAVSATSSDADTGWTFTLNYLVPDSAIPSQVRSQLAAGGPQAILAVARIGSSVHSEILADGSTSGVQVVVNAEFSQVQNTAVGNFLKFVDKQVGDTGAASAMYKILKTAGKVKDALAASKDYQDLMAQVDKIEQCAQNPTNPLTQKAYQSDPGMKDRILHDIESARTEITTNTAVSFVGQMISTGYGLIPDASWLGYVVGPSVSWSKDTLKKNSQELIDNLNKEVVACNGYQFEFSGSTTYVDPAGTGAMPTTTWHYWGVECPSSNQWLIWEYLDGWGGEYDTGTPQDSYAGPETVALGGDGSTTITYSVGGWSGNTTFAGTAFLLAPAQMPTTVHATIPNGEGTYPVDQPVVPYDGSFYTCPPN